MSSVGSTLKAEGVDQQLLVTASAHAVRQTVAAQETLSPDEASISSAGRLRGATMVVRDVVESLAQNPVWQAQQVQSSAPHQVQASSEGASLGEHTVDVQALATAQMTTTPTFSSLSTVIGIGTLNIEMGKWGGSSSTFATNPNWPKASVALDSRDNTLERVRDRINAAGVGVIAAVVSDATGSRLVLSASSTGADNGFRIQADPSQLPVEAAAGNQIHQFAFDPAQPGGAQGMQLVQQAQDARLSVDNRAMSSESNLVDDAPSGLRLSLHGTPDTPVQVNVKTDDDTIRRRLQSLAASSQDLVNQVQQAGGLDDNARLAHHEAGQVLDTLKANLSGPQSAAWQSIGLSWDDQTGVQQQDVNWTAPLKQQGQALFAALHQQWPQVPEQVNAQQAAPQADSAASSGGNSAAVQRNRQRLIDQYTAAAPAPVDLARQDFAVS